MKWLKEWNDFISLFQEKKTAENNYQWLKKYKNRDDIHIRFADLEKIGINPKYRYDNVLGVYTYPLAEIWPKVEENEIPFAGEKKYIHVLKENPNARIVEVSEYTEEDFQKDFIKIVQWDDEKIIQRLLKKITSSAHLDISLDREKLQKDLAERFFGDPAIMLIFLGRGFEFFSEFFIKKHSEPENIKQNLREFSYFKDDLNHFFDENEKIFNFSTFDSTRPHLVGGVIQDFTNTYNQLKRIFDYITKPKKLEDAIKSFYHGRMDKAQKKKIKNRIASEVEELVTNKENASELEVMLDYFGLELENYIHNNSNFSLEQELEIIKKIAKQETKLKTPFGMLWWIAWQGTRNAFEWAKLFLDIGIDAITDKTGTEIIHQNEPIQAVFINPKSYQRIAVLDNFLLDKDYAKSEEKNLFKTNIKQLKKELVSSNDLNIQNIQKFVEVFYDPIPKIETKAEAMMETFEEIGFQKTYKILVSLMKFIDDRGVPQGPIITGQDHLVKKTIGRLLEKNKKEIADFFIKNDGYLEMAEIKDRNPDYFHFFNKYLFQYASQEDDEVVKNELLEPMFELRGLPNDLSKMLLYVDYADVAQEYFEENVEDKKRFYIEFQKNAFNASKKKFSKKNFYSKLIKILKKQKINIFGLRLAVLIVNSFYYSSKKEIDKIILEQLVKALNKFPKDEHFSLEKITDVIPLGDDPFGREWWEFD